MAWPKTSRHERGYGSSWDKLRERILKRDRHICQCNNCRGGKLRITPANQVNHIVSKADWLKKHGNLDGVDHPDNLQAVNKACHDRITLEQKGHRYSFGCDANGFPLDPNHPWTRR